MIISFQYVFFQKNETKIKNERGGEMNVIIHVPGLCLW